MRAPLLRFRSAECFEAEPRRQFLRAPHTVERVGVPAAVFTLRRTEDVQKFLDEGVIRIERLQRGCRARRLQRRERGAGSVAARDAIDDRLPQNAERTDSVAVRAATAWYSTSGSE